MAKTFSVTFVTRGGRAHDLQVALTKDGWHVDCDGQEGACDRRGAPTLYRALYSERVNYPAGLGDYLEHLWERAAAGETNDGDLSRALDDLCAWIAACDRSTPHGFFATFRSVEPANPLPKRAHAKR
jgi:hypothetical protein